MTSVNTIIVSVATAMLLASPASYSEQGEWPQKVQWFQSAEAGDTEAILHLIRNYGRNMLQLRDAENGNALHVAAFHGHVKTAKALLDAGITMKARDNNGATALHWAVYQSQISIVQVLLDKGADFCARDMGGGTPVDWARNWQTLDPSPSRKKIRELLRNAGYCK